MKCPDCGVSIVTLSEVESSATVRWYRCNQGHRFFEKTGMGKVTEFSGLILAAACVLRLLLDHHGLFDSLDDGNW